MSKTALFTDNLFGYELLEGFSQIFLDGRMNEYLFVRGKKDSVNLFHYKVGSRNCRRFEYDVIHSLIELETIGEGEKKGTNLKFMLQEQ